MSNRDPCCGSHCRVGPRMVSMASSHTKSELDVPDGQLVHFIMQEQQHLGEVFPHAAWVKVNFELPTVGTLTSPSQSTFLAGTQRKYSFSYSFGGGGQVKVDLSYAHCESLQLLPSGLVSVRPLFKQVLLEALMQGFISTGDFSSFLRRRVQTEGWPSLPARPKQVGLRAQSTIYNLLAMCQLYMEAFILVSFSRSFR